MTNDGTTTDPSRRPAKDEPLLETDGLSDDFRLETSVVHAVQDVSLYVRAGETLVVVGESGSGKSATALSVLRLNPSPPVRLPERRDPLRRTGPAETAREGTRQGPRPGHRHGLPGPVAVDDVSLDVHEGETLALAGASGRGPQDPANGAVPEGVGAQTAQALRNRGAVLATHGLSPRDVVKVTAHLQHLRRDFAAYDAACREFFEEPSPVRATAGSALMDILVEIDVVARTPDREPPR